MKNGILADAFKTEDAGRWLLNKFYRIYPLFGISLTSIFVATQFLSGYKISVSQYILALVGLGWLSPPQVATFWFVSQLIAYIMLTAVMALIRSIKKRIILLISVYFILYLLILRGIDERIVMFYPAYFGGFVLSRGIYNLDLKRNVHLIGIISAVACTGILFFIRQYVDYEKVSILFKIACCIIIGTCLIYICLLISKLYFMAIICTIIGYASYCMYLIHRQVYEGTRIIIGKGFSRAFSYVAFAGMCTLAFMIQYCYSNILCSRKEKKR